MIAVTILVLCAVSAQGHPISETYSPPIPEYAQESVDALFDAKRDAEIFINDGLTKIGTDINCIIKDIVDGFILLATPALDIGEEKLNHLLDAGSELVSGIPLIGSVLEVGAKALEVDIKIWNKLGLSLLDVIKYVIDRRLEAINNVVQTYSKAIADASKDGASISKHYVKEESDGLNELYRKTHIAFETAYNAIPKEDWIEYLHRNWHDNLQQGSQNSQHGSHGNLQQGGQGNLQQGGQGNLQHGGQGNLQHGGHGNLQHGGHGNLQHGGHGNWQHGN